MSEGVPLLPPRADEPAEPAPPAPPVPQPPPPPADDKPFWEHSGFRTLVGTIYGIWLPFLYGWLVSLLGVELAIATLATVSVVLTFFGIDVVTRQAEARGRRQMVRSRRP